MQSSSKSSEAKTRFSSIILWTNSVIIFLKLIPSRLKLKFEGRKLRISIRFLWTAFHPLKMIYSISLQNRTMILHILLRSPKFLKGRSLWESQNTKTWVTQRSAIRSRKEKLSPIRKLHNQSKRLKNYTEIWVFMRVLFQMKIKWKMIQDKS